MAKSKEVVEEVVLSTEEQQALDIKQAMLAEFNVKAIKENWRVIKHSASNFTCECLINGEYKAIYSANSLGLAKMRVMQAIEEFQSRIECIDGPIVVVDFSIPVEQPIVK
jgi:ubiquinone/menaquinone biosynthesis C-methylase UbiE